MRFESEDGSTDAGMSRAPLSTSAHDGPALPLPGLGLGPRGPSPAHSIIDGRREEIGRYVVLRALGEGGKGVLGEGGMGVVLAAYDPDLDRKVALKILREGVRDGSTGELRMRREAQAMARLSHPNVAQVYEVAADDRGRLFLAMEFIEGVTLRAWLRAAPRPWREVLAVYVAAGRGLAAAHAAGLMHRDFKPDNAMVGTDGRVRVLDFGLSRLYQAAEDEPSVSASGRALEMLVTGAGALLGTPAYMSPEQHEREEADARSDQFSFCVALWEALYGRRPYAGETIAELSATMRRGELTSPTGTKVPAWVRRVLERGLAVEPSERWPTMDALLAALERDPQRARRRALAAATAVVAIAGASYGAAAWRVAEAQVCSGAADELAEAWGADARAAVDAAILGTGVAYAERAAAATREHLDDYAARWVAVHTSSCVSHQRGHMSPLLFDRRMACLRQRKRELAATATVLAQTTRETAAQAADAARGLPAVGLCEDDDRLLAAVAPPVDQAAAAAVEAARGRLARVQALERGGRHAEALAGVMPLSREAEALGFLPLRAETDLLAGKLMMYQMQSEAQAYLDRTLEWSLATHADEIAAEALALSVFNFAAIAHRPREAMALVPAAWGLMRRVDDPPELVALLHNNVASAWDELGEPHKAIAAYEQGLALLVAHAPADPMRWAIVNNLALSLIAVGEYERAGASLRAALPALEREYDPCFVLAVALRSTLAASDAAAGRVVDGIAGYEAAIACFGPEHAPHAVNLLGEVGQLHLLQGDLAAAMQQVVRAEARIAERPDAAAEGRAIAVLRVDVEIRRGDLEAARGSLAGIVAPLDGAAIDARWHVAAEIRRGQIAHLAGDPAAALEHLQRAAAQLGATVPASERGLLAFTEAQALRALGRDPVKVAARTQEAQSAFRSVGAAYAGELAAIAAWQAATGG